MSAWAHLDMMATEVGLLHYGSAGGLYDQLADEQAEALAWAMARAQAPELSGGPLSHGALWNVYNEIHSGRKPKQEQRGDLRAAMAAHMGGL